MKFIAGLESWFYSFSHCLEMIQLFLAIGLLLICLYFKVKYSFWTRKNVDQVAPVPIFGNLFDFVVTKKKHFGEIWSDIYKWVQFVFNSWVKYFKHNFFTKTSSYPKARYVGIYKVEGPALLIRDLDLIKDILVTKFNVFNMNDFALDPKVNFSYRQIFSLVIKIVFFSIQIISLIHWLQSIHFWYLVMIGKKLDLNCLHYSLPIEFELQFLTSTMFAKRWWSISIADRSHQHCNLTSKMLVTRRY